MASILRGCVRQPWLWIVVVAGISASLRFWQLGQYKALVFDEVYFVNYAQAYRQGLAPTDAHPPLGKYIIAVGIQLGDWLRSSAVLERERYSAGAALPSPFSYRQANALMGSLVPLIAMGTACAMSALSLQARQTRRDCDRKEALQLWTFAILCGLFIAIDGLFITESRYALLNVYVVCFGMLSHWLWLKASLSIGQRPLDETQLRKQHRKRILFYAASGVFLGGAIAVKWNGLGYLLSLAGWEAWCIFYGPSNRQSDISIRRRLRNLAFLILMATITYSLLWWPHLHVTQESLFSVHAKLFGFHQQLGADGHSACSKWYSWPLLIRPITYWYSQSASASYTVSNLGNPALWLLSSSTVLLLAIRYFLQAKRFLFAKLKSRPTPLLSVNPPSAVIVPYLLIGYFCNWLPWILVQRCTFNYLYMPAALFSFMALAWLLSLWLWSSNRKTRFTAWLMLGLIAIAFLFWLPLMLGLPLSSQNLKMRWLLKSWI